MTHRVRTFAFILAGLLVLTFGATPARAADCAFQDANDNGIFDAGDTIVPAATWIGNPFTSTVPFVVPVGCEHILNVIPAPFPGVRVIAPKITFNGVLEILKAGGRGITFWADPAVSGGVGDGSINIGDGATLARIEGGGVNLIFTDTIPAVFQRSLTFLAAGPCTINKASLRGFVPTGSTEIGMNCNGDIIFRASTVIGSRVNIQSITGSIDARSFTALPVANLGNFCDDPVTNLTANGNNNGLLDAGDFPCQLDFNAIGPGIGVKNFADAAALQAFCGATEAGGANLFAAFNDPLIFIAEKLLDLRGGPGGADTILTGRYRVTMASVTDDVLTQNTQVNAGAGTPPGGHRITVAAHPTSVNRLLNDREDFFGPATGTLNIDGACYLSPNKVLVLNGMTVAGTPDPAPCKQFPADFTFQANIIH